MDVMDVMVDRVMTDVLEKMAVQDLPVNLDVMDLRVLQVRMDAMGTLVRMVRMVRMENKDFPDFLDVPAKTVKMVVLARKDARVNPVLEDFLDVRVILVRANLDFLVTQDPQVVRVIRVNKDR